MSSLLYRLGLFVTKRAKLVFIVNLIVLIIAGSTALSLGGKLADDFTIPGTESQNGMELLHEQLPELAGATLQLIFYNKDGSDIVTSKKPIVDYVDKLNKTDGIAMAVDPFVTMRGGTINAISKDKKYALVLIQLTRELDNLDHELINSVEKESKQVANENGMNVQVGGNAFTTTSVKLSGYETVGVLLALVVLSVTFGSLIAAGLPLVSALIGVGITMSIIMSIAAFTHLSTTTPTLAIMLGLAVGIDYALFILHRHRELLRDGSPVRDAICFSMATSGGAVVFAGVTVIIALCGLMLANIPFLTGIGLCAAMGVGMAVYISLTSLPSLMMMLGEKLRPRPRRKKKADPAKPQRFAGMNNWWVSVTTKHPLLTILAVVVIIGAIAVPAKDLYLSLPDNGTEPKGTPARTAYDLISKEFGAGANGPLVVVGDIINSTDPIGITEKMADDISKVEGVDDIMMATPNPNASIGVVMLVPDGAQDDPKTARTVAKLRDLAPELEKRYNISDVKVTGFTAVAIDVSDRLSGALLPFGLVVVGMSFILLLIVFRSIVVPIKATLGYLFSVFSALGVASMVFTYGWGASLLGVEHSGTVLSFMPIIVMGVLFGLAMDYEVFLVSRMREEYVTTHKPMHAIKRGFNSSATVVTAAALIMTFVFASFIPGGDFYVQQMALGLTVGVAIDAFVVRMTLVPAVMALLGHKAWWLPKWLEKRLPVFDVEGEAISRQLNYQRWEKDNGKAAVKLDNVFILDGLDDEAHDGCSAIIRPGSLVELVGTISETQAACALFSGRVASFTGEAWIDGYNLRDEPHFVHGHTALIDMRDADISTLRLHPDAYPIAVAYIPQGNVNTISNVTPDAITRIKDYVAGGGTFVYPASMAHIVGLEGQQLDCQHLYRSVEGVVHYE